MTGSLRDTPSLTDRGDSPLPGVRIDNVLTHLVSIDRVIGEHGWRQDNQGGYQASGHCTQ